MKAIAALEHRVEMLNTRRRYLRSSKSFAAAIARAQALPRSSDSLVVARLQVLRAYALLRLDEVIALPDPRFNGVYAGRDIFLEVFSLLSAAATTIRQRWAANTLLRRTCRPGSCARGLQGLRALPRRVLLRQGASARALEGAQEGLQRVRLTLAQ